MNTSPVYLDRIAKVLAKSGITLKRSQLLETAAAAFGYHNSNEFSAAAKRGDLDPPGAQPLGSIRLPNGKGMVIVTDTLSGNHYGIDETFISDVAQKERGECIGVTPYGNLVYLGELIPDQIPSLNMPTTDTGQATAPIAVHDPVTISRDTLEYLIDAANSYAEDLSTGLEDGTYDDEANLEPVEAAIAAGRECLEAPTNLVSTPSIDESHPELAETYKFRIPIFTANIDHKNGTNSYSAMNKAALYAQLAEYCEEYWKEIAGQGSAPISTDGLTNQEIVDTYFDSHDREFLNLGESILQLPDQQAIATIASNYAGTYQFPHIQHVERTSDPKFTSSFESITKILDIAQIGSSPQSSFEYIKDVASTLHDGALADIWYDADDFIDDDDEDNTDQEASDTITETQNAMTEAARILRNLVDLFDIPTRQAPSHSDGTPTIWLTDNEGEPIQGIEKHMAYFQQIGMGFQVINGALRPLTDEEEKLVQDRRMVTSKYPEGRPIYTGQTILFAGQKYHAPTVKFEWAENGNGVTEAEALAELDRTLKAVVPAVSMLNGHILQSSNATDFSHEIHLLLPIHVASDAPELKDYFAALDYLINGKQRDDSKKVVARFRPQAAFRDNIISVDPNGPDRFDVTFELLLIGSNETEDLEDDFGLRDSFISAHSAPAWVQGWDGPFEIDIDQTQIDALFNRVR